MEPGKPLEQSQILILHVRYAGHFEPKLPVAL